jgi:hypothetical protein
MEQHATSFISLEVGRVKNQLLYSQLSRNVPASREVLIEPAWVSVYFEIKDEAKMFIRNLGIRP